MEGTVNLRLYGALQHAVGSRVVAVSAGDATVGAVLEEFVRDKGARAAEMIYDGQGNLWRSLIVMVNDEPADDGSQTQVRAGDTLSLLLPVAGG